jgi:hypothetical protein
MLNFETGMAMLYTYVNTGGHLSSELALPGVTLYVERGRDGVELVYNTCSSNLNPDFTLKLTFATFKGQKASFLGYNG